VREHYSQDGDTAEYLDVAAFSVSKIHNKILEPTKKNKEVGNLKNPSCSLGIVVSGRTFLWWARGAQLEFRISA